MGEMSFGKRKESGTKRVHLVRQTPYVFEKECLHRSREGLRRLTCPLMIFGNTQFDSGKRNGRSLLKKEKTKREGGWIDSTDQRRTGSSKETKDAPARSD